MLNRAVRALPALLLLGLAPVPAAAGPVEVDPSGATAVPAFQMPSSALMSPEGNASRVEHIQLKRSLKGQPTDAFYRGVFGPGLVRMQATYPVTAHDETMGGVHVRVYEPRAGVTPENAGKVLVNIHGGGFVACFAECGGMESIPVAALTGLKVISIDYRMAPAAHYPAATDDVVEVYREVLKRYPAKRIGVFGCSAGGILTAQTLAALPRRGLPEPAAAGVYCAGGDDMAGDSRVLGNLLGDGEAVDPTPPARGLGYMEGARADDPEAYPARHPDVLAKFPPTLVIAGTRDFALSSAVSLHSKLVANGVDARLHLWEGGRHAFFYDPRIPESREAYAVMARFFTDHLK